MNVGDRFRGWEMTFVATILLPVHWSLISLYSFLSSVSAKHALSEFSIFFPALTSFLFRRRRRRRTFQNWNSGSKAFNSPHGALALKHRESWSERRRPFYTREQSIAIYTAIQIVFSAWTHLVHFPANWIEAFRVSLSRTLAPRTEEKASKKSDNFRTKLSLFSWAKNQKEHFEKTSL